VYPCRRADEAVARLADDERSAHADDALRLAQDPFHTPRIALVAGDLARTLGRLDIVELHDATLDLRDRLLRDDDDVAVLELCALCNQRGQIVALPQLWQPFDGQDREAAHEMPVT